MAGRTIHAPPIRSQLDRAERGISSTNQSVIVNHNDNQARDRNPNSRSIKSSEGQKGGIYPRIRETRAYCFGNVAKSGNSLLRSPQRRLTLLHRLACLRRPRGAAEHPSGSERLEPPGRRLVLRRGWRGNPEQARAGGAVSRWCSATVSLADLFAGIALHPCLLAFTGARQQGGKGQPADASRPGGT